MEDFDHYTPLGWRRDLTHIVGCFYATQITPLKDSGWADDLDKFLQVMEAKREMEWLGIKELTQLRFMPYIAHHFEEATGHHLSGLSDYKGWIRAKDYYHWKVAKWNELEHCPNL